MQTDRKEIEVRKQKQQKVQDLLDLYRGSIAAAMPSTLTPDRMIRAVLSATVRTPELLDCTQYSLMGAVLTVAGLGLMPDGTTGEAYLTAVRRGKIIEANFIVGYKGLCTLAYRSGLVASIVARAVYEGDEFDYELGLNEKLKHIPKGNTNPAQITHFYSIVRMVNGGHSLDVMPVDVVNKARDESENYIQAPVKEETIWHKNYADMGCKTVLRRNLKYTPFSAEVAKAIAHDELGDVGKQNMKLEVLQELATTDEMKDAAYAEVIETEHEKKEKLRQEAIQRNKNKVKKAEDDTLKMIAAKKITTVKKSARAAKKK